MIKHKLLCRIIFFGVLSLFILPVNSEENVTIERNTEYNVYTGMFDFSDHGKRSNIIGIQHQNESLNRDTFLGNLSPVTGAMITGDSATYVYTGVQAQYKVGNINLTPSFTPGLYGAGNGKDLGHIVEFKSEVQFSLELPSDSQLGFSYNHISNASLGEKNPGANSYMFNFLKKF
jgi:lipid A 3-O-deacylase